MKTHNSTKEIIMNDHHRAYLQYRALSYRFEEEDMNQLDNLLRLQFVDENDKPIPESETEKMLKLQNVCAKIPVFLFNRLDATISVLGISKRRFIELAITSALEEADAIMAENKVAIPEYKLEMEVDG